MAATLRTALAAHAVGRMLAQLPPGGRGESEAALGAAMRDMAGAATLDVGARPVTGALLCLPGAVEGLLCIIKARHEHLCHALQCIVCASGGRRQTVILSLVQWVLALVRHPASCVQTDSGHCRDMARRSYMAIFLPCAGQTLTSSCQSAAIVPSVHMCSFCLQEPIAEAIDSAAAAEAGTSRPAPVWRPAALYAAALLAEVTRDSHPDALARCTPLATKIKAAVQHALDSPLVQQPGDCQ